VVSALRPGWRGAAVLCAVAVVTGIAVRAAADRESDRAPAGGWAFVPPLAGDEAVVWAVGDGADGGRSGKAVAARIAKGPVDRVLYLGDVYDDGTAAEFADEYRTTYGRVAPLTAPVSGNHDSSHEPTGYDPYWRRVHGVRPPDWYAFRAAGWTILAIDSEAPHTRRSAQERWLRRVLRAPGHVPHRVLASPALQRRRSPR
jgi:hypothetical protein